MKIAVIGSRGIPPNYGGTETYVEQLSLQLAAQGDQVLVYGAPLGDDDRLLAHASAYPRGIRRIEIPSLPGKHIDNFLRTFLATLHVCFMRDVQIVQFNNIGPALFSFLPRLFGKKVVGAIRAMDARREKWGMFARSLLRICERLVVVFPHAATTNSRAIAAYYWERYKVDVHYIPNGAVHPTHPVRPPCVIRQWGLDRRGYVLFVARLVPEKGCHTLIEAFEKVTWPDMKLVVAGDSPYRDTYVRELFSHESDRVRFVGHVTGEVLEELYSNAYAFVLPSSIEGMSNSLLSALAHGCPVIVSDIDENVAVIEHADGPANSSEKAALVFRLGDSDDLAAKLTVLRDDSEQTSVRGKLLKSFAQEHYSWEASATQTRQVYQQILARK